MESVKGLEKLEDRTYRFALRVIKLVQSLPKGVVSEVLGRQLLEAATSMGANVEEAIGASSKKDFIAKMTIVRKESREAHYWLRLIRDSELVKPPSRMNGIIQEALELKKIFSKTVTSAKKQL